MPMTLTQDVKMRLGGLGLLALSAAAAWYFILLPPGQARARAPEIEIHTTTGFLLPPMCLIFGLAFVIGGEKAKYRDTSRPYGSPTALGWALGALTFAAAMWYYFWAQAQFAALGYRF